MQQETTLRLTRRGIGHVSARLDELHLDDVVDPRKGKATWKIRTLLTAATVGMAAGCKGLGDVETLTTWLGVGARKRLRLWRRVPDTTLRDLLMALRPGEVRKLIRQAITIAHRRKQLQHDLPLRAVSMDGKGTSSWLFDKPNAKEKYGQIQDCRTVIRTITSCLVSVPGRPCLDAHPIPPETNEMGAFQDALDALLSAYRRTLFDVVMYDSGACSLENASYIKDKGLDYVLCLTLNQPTLLIEAERLLDGLPLEQCVAQTVDLDGSDVVTRRLFVTDKLAGWLDWSHLRTVIRLHCHRVDKVTGEVKTENRHYLSSLAMDRLTPDQWLTLVRRRWSVENENHNTYDTAFSEDDRPWILAPRGMVVVMLLRRLVYNLLTLYRSVTLRSESNRAMRWPTLLKTVHMALLKATLEALAGICQRNTVTG
jgi:hypothetical protein